MSKSAKQPPARMIDMNRPKDGPLKRYTTTNLENFSIRPRNADIKGNDPEDQSYAPELYIKNGVQIDPTSPLQKLINMGLIKISDTGFTRKGYTAYKFFQPLIDSINYDSDNNLRKNPAIPKDQENPDPTVRNENDCLKFGEAMGIAMRSGAMNFVMNHLQTDQTDPELCLMDNPSELFGDSIIKNRKFYKKTAFIDNHAIPEPGQAYAIVRRESVTKEKIIPADYHIAFVIYREGGINITLEAEANAGYEYYPHFAFYDTNPAGYTFHKRWAGLLPDDEDRRSTLYYNAHTIILAPRPYKIAPTKRARSASASARSAKSSPSSASNRKTLKRRKT